MAPGTEGARQRPERVHSPSPGVKPGQRNPPACAPNCGKGRRAPTCSARPLPSPLLPRVTPWAILGTPDLQGQRRHSPNPPADLGKLRTRGKVTWTVSLGPGLAAPSQPTCLEGQGRLRAQQIGQADLGRPKEEDMAIRDPSLSPSRRRPSPPPRVILGRVIQPPPGAASQAAEGHALLRIRGTALHLDGRGSGELGTLSRRPPPRLGWTRRTSPGASPSSAITQWPLSRHSVLPVMSEARETDSRGPLARPGAGTRVPEPRCSGSR